MKLVSIVAPVFNERASLEELHARLDAMSAGEPNYRFELIFVDDGSHDGSVEVLAGLRARDPRVRVVSLSRNFGHQLAVTAGMDAAVGDAVVVMDGDLQHPPELVPTLLRKWEAGAEVVNTIRDASDDSSTLKNLTSRAFYALYNGIADVPVQARGADFRLLDRRAADALHQVRERARFVRGLVHWIGFRQDQVAYRAEPRFADRSKFTFGKMLQLATNGLFGFSTAPLQVATWIGLFATVGAAFYACYALYVKLVAGTAVTGWTSLLLTILVLGGAQLLTLGIVGSYIARIYDEVRQRPLYLLSSIDPPNAQRKMPRDAHDASVGPDSATE